MNTSAILGENYPIKLSPFTSSHYLDNETNKRIKLEAVNEDNMNEAIKRLKNKSSYGHDEISNKIIKNAKNSLIQPLMLIINPRTPYGTYMSHVFFLHLLSRKFFFR